MAGRVSARAAMCAERACNLHDSQHMTVFRGPLMMRFLSLVSIAAVAACTAADVQVSERVSTSETAPVWRLAEQGSDVRAASCPDGVSYQKAQSISIEAELIEAGSKSSASENLSGLSLTGAWHLTSDNDEFGGLSGVDVMRSGSLLAISDDGKFVWIGIDPETGAPDGIGSMAYMRDPDGDIFPRKRDADSEGLVFHDGIAFVSFEQDHRIAAYDLESCGVAAYGAPVVTLDKVVGGSVLRNNGGAEALTLVSDVLRVGFETHQTIGSPIGTVRTDGTLDAFQRTVQPSLYVLTGLDASDGLVAQVFRAYDPARGARAIVRVYDGDTKIAEAQLKQPLPVDNIEAIAIDRREDGGTRLWLLSDDNFSLEQRTLLLALDLDQE